jgi:hypothetical protein
MLRKYYRTAKKLAFRNYSKTQKIIDTASPQIQCLLKQNYRLMRHLGGPLPRLTETGFKNYSEFEEDGILLFIFSIIGEQSRRVVEMCAGNGTECMATNLIINHSWEGFLFDGNPRNVARGRNFFEIHPATKLMPPVFTHAWLTAENVNQVLEQAGVTGEIDLLSIDVDGNDYWLWKSIEIIRPRVCIFETHNIIPTNLSLTIPYDPNFYAWNKPGAKKDFRSASLAAMVKLSREKGYRLIGSHQHGFNVFFMRNDIGTEYFHEVSMEQVHDNPWTRLAQAKRWPLVKGMDWQEV